MNQVDALLSSNESFKFVQVVFQQQSRGEMSWSQPYTYKTLEDIELNDFVVVEVNRDEIPKLKVAKVVNICDIHEIDYGRFPKCRWVVSKVDTDKYKACVESEKKIEQQLSVVKAKKLREAALSNLEESIGAEGLLQLSNMAKEL